MLETRSASRKECSPRTAARARAALEAAGYSVRIEQAPHGEIGAGHAIDTDPPAGTELPEGRPVVIRESSGEE